MRKQFLCGVAVVAVTAIGGPASAADMPVKASKAPPLPAIFNWSGFYIGGHVGSGSAKFDFSTGFDSGRRSRLIAGGQLGYNWQIGSVVWGLEGDITGLSIKDGQVSPMEAEVDLLASIRGRLGLTFDNVLVYGTAGFGYVRGKAEAQTLGTILSTNVNGTRGVVGGGVEWAFNRNWSVRGEALDYLGHKGFDLGGDIGNKISDIWVARFAVNYRF
jgi:outer membrane immunogenic protein